MILIVPHTQTHAIGLKAIIMTSMQNWYSVGLKKNFCFRICERIFAQSFSQKRLSKIHDTKEHFREIINGVSIKIFTKKAKICY
jgi:hypothetical protein